MLTPEEIQQIIPHRYPFLMVDRILEIEEGQRAVGIKNVSINEPFFQGHFPGYAVMPGVLVVESLAQVGAVALMSAPERRGKVVFLAGLDGVRFKRQVVPGDTLRLEVTLTKMRGPIGKGSGVATVDGQLAARADMLFALSG